jgi:hypothetical protein
MSQVTVPGAIGQVCAVTEEQPEAACAALDRLVALRLALVSPQVGGGDVTASERERRETEWGEEPGW